MDNVFFIADTHFAHKNILKFNDRPFANIDEHDEYLIKRWNETVSKKDMTYVLGDFAWRDHQKYMNRLNGKKVLIVGSHDHMNEGILKNWTEVHQGMLIRNFNGISFVLTHCAMRVWEKSHYGAINLHGHSHGRLKEDDRIRQMDVGVDAANDYAPFSLEFIMYKMGLKLEWAHKGDEGNVQVGINRAANKKILEQFELSKRENANEK